MQCEESARVPSKSNTMALGMMPTGLGAQSSNTLGSQIGSKQSWYEYGEKMIEMVRGR